LNPMMTPRTVTKRVTSRHSPLRSYRLHTDCDMRSNHLSRSPLLRHRNMLVPHRGRSGGPEAPVGYFLLFGSDLALAGLSHLPHRLTRKGTLNHLLTSPRELPQMSLHVPEVSLYPIRFPSRVLMPLLYQRQRPTVPRRRRCRTMVSQHDPRDR
jgi:hypothetical protein